MLLQSLLWSQPLCTNMLILSSLASVTLLIKRFPVLSLQMIEHSTTALSELSSVSYDTAAAQHTQQLFNSCLTSQQLCLCFLRKALYTVPVT